MTDTDVWIVTVRGTGEQQDGGENMLDLVVDQIGSPHVHYDLPYPASISFANSQHNLFGISGDRSVVLGVEKLRQTIQNAAPNVRFILLGYSLGGIITSLFLESAEEILLDRILAVGHIANPMRQVGASAGRATTKKATGCSANGSTRANRLVSWRWRTRAT